MSRMFNKIYVLEVVQGFSGLGEIVMFIDGELIRACRYCNLVEIKALVKQGANMRVWDDCPLRVVAQYGYLDAVKYFVDHGADIHARDDGALRAATYYKHLDVVKYLVEQGSNIHAMYDWPLRWAVYYGHLETANFLREAAGTGYKCHECLIKSTCLELCEDFRSGER